MAFISYAQNFEDIMLWRALKHVEQGFYIDVGANDPVIESVTKAFSERGWKGINIEPLQTHYLDLEKDRPRDINLQCAAGEVNGEIEIWEGEVRGWATASKEVVSQYVSNGCPGKFHKVPVFKLTDICEKYVESEIHFLKIDVEGFEKSVISGMDFTRFRPWLMVIEATRPNSTVENFAEWEGAVFTAGYELAYYDGLNRFYVANEHLDLMESFKYPPNVFDNYIRNEQLSTELRAQQAENSVSLYEAKIREMEELAQVSELKLNKIQLRVEQAETESHHAWMELKEVYSSHSWRITKPLRWLMHQIRLLREYGLKVRVDALVYKIIYLFKFAFGSIVNPSDAAKEKIIINSKKVGLDSTLRYFYRRFIKKNSLHESAGYAEGVLQPVSLDELSANAKKIYTELKSSLNQPQGSK